MTVRDQARLEALLARFETRPRPVRVVSKQHFWHQNLVDWLLRVLTLGGQSTYLTEYVTTLGHTIYVPEGWERWDPGVRWEVLRHEGVHVAQFERYGWVGMVILYGLLPFPVGLAYGRARLEWEAYAETLRAVAERQGLQAARSPALRARIVRQFAGPAYAWMWPFPRQVERWIDEALSMLEKGGLREGEVH